MPKFQPNTCVRQLREKLAWTQDKLATAIGSTQPTIQSIETGRLRLSEAFAFAMERATGISHRWLLENDPAVPPVTPTGKPWTPEYLSLAEEGAFSLGEEAHLLPRIRLLRLYVLARLIADELGYRGTVATGFNSLLQNTGLDLLATIADKKLRALVYRKAVDLTSGGNEDTLKMVLADARDLLRVSREHTKRIADQDIAIAEHSRIRRQAPRASAA
jgi:transcriptional regulator with XRE-family HTH domain